MSSSGAAEDEEVISGWSEGGRVGVRMDGVKEGRINGWRMDGRMDGLMDG